MLKDVRNLKQKFVITCYTCKLGYYDGLGAFCCKRIKDEGYELFDVGDGHEHNHVCDLYVKWGKGKI